MYQAKIFNSSGKICAFCKYWNDKDNSVIEPLNKVTGIWLYDDQSDNYCRIKRKITKSSEYCKRFKCKVTEY